MSRKMIVSREVGNKIAEIVRSLGQKNEKPSLEKKEKSQKEGWGRDFLVKVGW